MIQLIKRGFFLVAIALTVTWLLRHFVVDTISVASASMEPTLPVGNHYWVNCWIYRFNEPERGDIIVFTSPVDQTTGYIKRVIALPHDTLQIQNKQVIVNGKPLEEPYAVYHRKNERLEGDNLGPFEVPDNGYFVLGDNRDESYDSTTWKNPQTNERIFFLPKDHIKGRLIQLL